MKKFLIFLLSFIVLIYIFEIGSGLIMTLMYTPDITFATTQSQTVEFGTISHPFSYVFALFASCIAYFLSQRLYHAK
ncbi:hypothetical protein [Cytobacillus kochii]|uniref:hypothetical protein n=1 Tax=Cytobacillus kochii TaxID=859143 RepID=UPI0025A0F24B|nr:hypothetical protein [Cytobacillus kochii]MDM5209364.1 hypothetical protein [Cytobacillus kochii]